MEFRWNEWNIEHLVAHEIYPEEAEQVVRDATSTYPGWIGEDKLLVSGAGLAGRLLQIIFVMDDDGTDLTGIGTHRRTPLATSLESKRAILSRE